MRICHLDLETSYLVGATWGMWQQDVVTVLQDPYILGFGYSWNHLEGTHWIGMSDFPAYYKKHPNDDKLVVKALHKIFEEADVIVAHNGKAFDVKKSKGRFLIHGLTPPSFYKVVDTKTVAKQFGYPSNKLDELGRTLLHERKIRHDGIDLWTRCMAKKLDLEAWQKMADYCKQDVILLKRLYNLMLPWIDNHPNWNVYSDTPPSCTNCGSGRLRQKGYRYNVTTRQQRFQCGKCGKYSSGKSTKLTEIR